MAFEDQKVREFLDELASDSPAPGGGSVAALGASLGAGLVSMVCNLTIGKEKYKDSWDVLKEVVAKSEALRARFVKLMTEDTESFNVYMAAMKMPKDTDEQKEVRKKAMSDAARGATEVPLTTLECCVELADLAQKALKHGNPNASSDAGCATLFALAAGKAASYNVRINLPGVKDEAVVKELRRRTDLALDSLSRYARNSDQEMDRILG